MSAPAEIYENKPLTEVDPDMHALIVAEQKRQLECLEFIASEVRRTRARAARESHRIACGMWQNFTSNAVMEALGSCLTNKYAEGVPGDRYYGGTEIVDQVERLCQTRALALYGLDSK